MSVASHPVQNVQSSEEAASESDNAPLGFLMFRCPGCDQMHGVKYSAGGAEPGYPYTWNGDALLPTFTPDIYAEDSTAGPPYVCHMHVENGVIYFHTDSLHALAGRTMLLPVFIT